MTLLFFKPSFSVEVFKVPHEEIRSYLSITDTRPLLSHLQGVLYALSPLRRVRMKPADGFITHGADTSDFQPLYQTPVVERSEREKERETERLYFRLFVI